MIKSSFPFQALFWGQIGMSGRTLLTFIVSILAAKALGAESFGLYVALIAWVELLIKLTDMGLYTTFSVYIPRLLLENREGQCSYLVRQVLIRRFLLILVVGGTFFFLHNESVWLATYLDKSYLSILLVLFLMRGTMDGFIFIVIARVDMRYYSGVEIGVSIAQLAGVLFLVEIGIAVENLLWLMVVVNGLQLLFYGFRSRTILHPSPESFSLGRVRQFARWVWLGTLFNFMQKKSIDLLLLLFLINDKKVIAHYEVAYMLVLYGGMVLLTSVERLSPSLYSSALVQDGVGGLVRIWQQISKLAVVLAVPVLVFLLIHADHLILVFYSEEFLDAAVLIRLFAGFQILIVILAGETTQDLLFPLDREPVFLYLNAFQGLLNLISGIVLIHYFGAIGAVVATAGSAALAAVVNLLVVVAPLETAVKVTEEKPNLFFGLANRLSLKFSVLFLVLSTLLAAPTRLYPEPGLFALMVLALSFALVLILIAPRVLPITREERAILSSHLPKGWVAWWLPKSS
ncbi:MAG: oligosaccharide flippase family protein [Magnetococcales bacterium]|nr:oligosaccharide flippase family protein [Magnetococcales bacterium]